MSDARNIEKEKNERVTVWPQWLTAVVVSLAPLTSGLANGWTSPYLAQLRSDETNVALKLTDIEASWVASLLILGRVGGALIGAVCQEHFGRKKVLMYSGMPLTLSWIFNIYALSVPWLYISRICSGVGSGILWLLLALYIAEIADPKIRGSLISMCINASSVGVFLGNVMGSYLSMEMFAYVSLVPNILFMILISLIPESPYHYVLHGDMDKAEASLKWFRRKIDVKVELQELQEFVDGANTNIMIKVKEFMIPANFKNGLIMIILAFFANATGITIINSYAEIIVEKSNVNVTPSIVVMVLGFSTIVAGATAVIAVDKFGRRSLLMISSSGVAISFGFLGLHFYLTSLGIDTQKLTWLPLISLLSYYLFVSYGMVPVPGTLIGEVFSANLKNIASLILSICNSLISFLFIKTYQVFTDLTDEKIVFWTYGVIALVCVPFIYFFIPETKGKTLFEIQKSNKT